MNIKIFAIFFLTLLIYSCRKEEDHLLEDMAYLDKSYMEALLDTRDSNSQRSRLSIERFILDWNNFKKKYYNANEEDPQWKTDFDSLQDILIRSHYYISSGEDEGAGYLILHDIKYVLSDLRKRNNVNWFFDNLNSVYKTAYRMWELSKIYVVGDIALTKEEEERLTMSYYSLASSVKTTINEFDRSNLFLLELNNERIEAIRHNVNAINDLVNSIEKDMSLNIYDNIENICGNILNIYFNSIQIMKD